MAAAMNGMALHGGVIPYSGTFLVFSDYCRPAIRLAALMGERVIHVMTHDSIGLGEDGPTHQPVEHLAALRAIPNLLRVPPVRRGRDGRVLAARAGSATRRPSVLALTRQNLPQLRTRRSTRQPLRRRRLRDRRRPSGKAQVSLFATGSEVAIAVEAQKLLGRQGHRGARRLGAVLRTVPRRSPTTTAPRRHRRRAGQGRRRGRDPAGLGRHHRLRRRLRRHDRLRRQRARTRTSTSTSASPPRRSPRRR